jgi:hypothetical protein
MKTLLVILAVVFSWLNEDWVPYFENKEIAVYYKTTHCEDIQNGVSFEYYLIQVRNMTNETLVVNFYLGSLNERSEENKVAFVLNPLEVKSGSCDYQPIKLRLFRSENSKKAKGSMVLFNLNTISAIEVY